MIWLASLLVALAAGADSPITVPPGSVVRWAGDGIESCQLDRHSYRPTGDACLVPMGIDRSGTVVASRSRHGVNESITLEVGAYPYPVQRLHIQDESKVHLSKEDLARVERENQQIANLWSRGGEVRFALPLTAPLEPLPSGGRFGSRRIINGEPRSAHSGTDYAAHRGTPVLAADDGVVALAADFFFSGNSIFLDHGDGLITMYFHLHELFVKPGQEITRSAVIGTVGSTGRSTGPHLHFGARWQGERVDPAMFLSSPSELRAVGE